MHELSENFVYGLVIMIQMSGLVTLVAARVCHPDCQAIWNTLFFAALALVGWITFLSIRQESGHWLISSSTLAVMVVGSVLGSPSPATSSTI